MWLHCALTQQEEVTKCRLTDGKWHARKRLGGGAHLGYLLCKRLLLRLGLRKQGWTGHQSGIVNTYWLCALSDSQLMVHLLASRRSRPANCDT